MPARQKPAVAYHGAGTGSPGRRLRACGRSGGSAKKREKRVTVQARNADLTVAAAEDRDAVPVGLPPVVPTVHIEDADGGPVPAQGHQLFQHQFAEVAPPATVDDQIQYQTKAPQLQLDAGRVVRTWPLSPQYGPELRRRLSPGNH